MPCRTWSIIPTAAPSRRSTASCRRSSRRTCCCGMKLDLKEIEKNRTNLNARRSATTRSGSPRAGSAIERNPVFDEARSRAAWSTSRRQRPRRPCSSPTAAGAGSPAGANTPCRTPPPSSSTACSSPRHNGVASASRHARTRRRLAQELPGRRKSACSRTPPTKTIPYKEHADNIDALVYMVLVDAGHRQRRDARFPLSRPHAHRRSTPRRCSAWPCTSEPAGRQAGDDPARTSSSIVVQDDENQTAYLQLPANNPWWYWYGSEIEANAYYLKLLARTSAQGRDRRRGWSSTCSTTASTPPTGTARATRPSASRPWPTTCKNSGEDRPDMTVEVWLDGKKHKEVHIDTSNLFTLRQQAGAASATRSTTGKHTLEIKRKGTGPVYFNAYLTNFTLEDFITQGRPGSEGQPQVLQADPRRQDRSRSPAPAARPLDQQVEKYKRIELANLATAQERRPRRSRAGDRQQERLRVPDLRGHEGRRLRAGGGAQRLHRTRTGRLHGAARREGLLLRPAPGPRQALASATACVPRSPGQFSALADAWRTRCTRRS